MTSLDTTTARSRRAWAWPLTHRGGAAVVVGVGCFAAAEATGARELQYLGVVLLALVAGAAVLHLAAPPRVVADRRIGAGTVERGRSGQVSLLFSSRRRLTGTWRQPLPSGLTRAAPAQAASADLPTSDAVLARALGLGEPGEAEARAGRGLQGGFEAGDDVHTVEYAVTGVHRGDWALPPLRLRIDDPFGLVRCEVRVGGDSPILVVPPLAPLVEIDLRGSEPGSARASTRLLGQNADNLTPRPYAPGDSIRRVHWRASARRGDLMVRQDERETDREAAVLLDRDVRRWESDADFERAVAAAASVAWRLAGDGFSVRVVDEAWAPLALVDEPSPDARDRLQATLARVNRRIGGPDRGTRAASGAVVAIVGAADADLARDLVRAHTSDAFAGVLATRTSPEARRTLMQSGWRVAILGDDLADSWRRLTDGPPADRTAGRDE